MRSMLNNYKLWAFYEKKRRMCKSWAGQIYLLLIGICVNLFISNPCGWDPMDRQTECTKNDSELKVMLHMCYKTECKRKLLG
jgi:hypothetical protein